MQPASKQSEAELYEQFKLAQQALESELKKFKPTSSGLESLMSQSSSLPKLFETASKNLLRDLTFSWKKTIDQRVWNILKTQVNQFITCQDLEGFVDSIGEFYRVRVDLMKKLVGAVFNANQTMEAKLGDQSERMIVANLFYHYGELLENMEKTRSSKGLKKEPKTFQTASNLYFKAINLFPYRGKYYYLFAELTAFNHDYFGSMYWCIRAQTCRDPANCKKQLSEIFEKADLVDMPTTQTKEKAREGLVWSFIKYFHEVSLDRKEINVTDLLVYLRKFIHYIKQGSTEQAELILMSYIIQMSLYSTFVTVESMNLKRSFFQIKENPHYRHTIKNSFLIIVTVLDMLSHTNHPEKLLQLTNLLLPILAYLTEYPSTLRLLSQIFHDFDQLLVNIYHTYLPHKTKFRCQFKIFDKEVNLIGWKMFGGYYEKHRAMELERDNTMKVAWVVETIEKFEHIEHKLKDGKKADVKVRVKEEKEKEKRLVVRKDRTLIVADGRNVAIRHGKNQYFSAKGLEIVVRYWMDKGYPVLIILPQYCFDEEQIAKKRSSSKNNEKTLPAKPEDVAILKKFRKQQIAVGVPNSDYDDSYIIQYARDKKAYILSGDGFQDIYKDQRISGKRRDELREYLKSNCMTFTFIKDDFLPNPDFLKNKNMI